MASPLGRHTTARSVPLHLDGIDLGPAVARWIPSSRFRNWRAQSAQQKKRRSPSISSHTSPQVELQIAQPG